MIESAFLSCSSWDSDPFQDFGSEISSVFDGSEISSIFEFEDNACNIERICSEVCNCNTASNDFSSNSYDCGVFEDSEDFLSITDSFISEILEDSNSESYSNSERFSQCVIDGSEESNLSINSYSDSTNKSSRKEKKGTRGYLSTKAWSKMSPEEQIQTLHTLSEIVTYHMGIREQIEIIKIIDPSVSITPSDTEFALDSSSLNDSKMKRIRDYVQKHRFSSTNSKKINSSSKSQLPFVESSTKSLSSKLVSRKAISKRRRSPKKKTSKNEEMCENRKLHLHGIKELRSGLFVKEEIVKRLNNPSEEDEDVNILE